MYLINYMGHRWLRPALQKKEKVVLLFPPSANSVSDTCGQAGPDHADCRPNELGQLPKPSHEEALVQHSGNLICNAYCLFWHR